MDNFNFKNFINENNLGAYSKLEGKKRDVDGDGDIDSDDYMAAKDAAIKKAMGKNEEVEEDRFVASSMEDLEQVIRNLAHTANISEDEALEMAIKKLENMLDGRDDLDEGEIGEEDKIASDIQNALNKHGKDDSKKFQILKARKALNKGDMATAKKIVARYLKEDLDVGHQDDEPAMLKNTTYRAAKLAGMLYKKLDKYDNFPTEVDFPNWWQTKVTKAKDMLQAAYDYLDGEEGVAQVDAVTHEEVEEMKHPQYGTASNKYASRANKPGKFGNSPELNKTLGDTAAKAMDILKRKGLAEDNIKLSDTL